MHYDDDQSAGLIDCHPLIREFFSRIVEEKFPDSWRSANQRLFEHLSQLTDYQPDSFDDLYLLFWAIAHGCRAGQYKSMCDIYYKRILRQDREYSWKEAGTIGLDLETISLFFEKPWGKPRSVLAEADQGWVMNQASLYLRDLGRISESMEPIHRAITLFERMENWENAAISSSNLSDGALTMGNILDAYRFAESGLPFAERSGDDYWIAQLLGDHACASLQSGKFDSAKDHFEDAEIAIARYYPKRPMLYGLNNFNYCDLLLIPAEKLAWKLMLNGALAPISDEIIRLIAIVQTRAEHTLLRNEFDSDILATAAENLTICRCLLLKSIVERRDRSRLGLAENHLVTSVKLFSRVNVQQWMVRGLLTLAWLRFLIGETAGARADLDEAWDIAARGPMKLHMTDIYLYRARLFFRENSYPWNKKNNGDSSGPQDDLDEAGLLIEECGYHRRDEELAEAWQAVLQ
jgi:tetratricopeptide (TPR) repeat protein